MPLAVVTPPVEPWICRSRTSKPITGVTPRTVIAVVPWACIHGQRVAIVVPPA